MPSLFPAAERARLFLWICMHFLEPADNDCPWDSQESLEPHSAPKLSRADPDTLAEENADPPDEVQWGVAMTNARHHFLERDRVRQEALGAVNEEMALRDAAEKAPGPLSRVKDAEPPIRGKYISNSSYMW